MSRRLLAVLGVAAVLLLSGGALALYTGVGPAPGGEDGGERITDYATGTPLGTIEAGGGGGSGRTTAVAPFSFQVEAVEECGRTCRDVTVALTNNQDEPASDVIVFTRIHAGKNTTAKEDRIWEGDEDVGTLAAGGTHTATKRVELSLQEALEVENNDGWVTIVTTVRTADRTVTFKSVEQVA